MKSRKTILISYNYFLPAYKAGGPVQSLANMVRQLGGDKIDFKVLCSAIEYRTNEVLDVQSNTWCDFENGSAKIFYVTKERENRATIKAILNQTKIDLLFINGIFNIFYNIYPIILTTVPVLLSVRGMLHPGGLSQKSIKKKIFIKALKLWGITKKVSFHATDHQEEKYIYDVFGSEAKIFVCPNLPRLYKRSPSVKQENLLKICSIALVSPMKNHLQVLRALAIVKAAVNYDIYGPIKDMDYWKECLTEINKLPGNIQVLYHGDLSPELVENTLSKCDIFILPSKSENFGHALVEALSSGKPIITSHSTPWQNLESEKAGWNINPENIEELAKAIESSASLSNMEYELYSMGAATYIKKRIDTEVIKKQYLDMFDCILN